MDNLDTAFNQFTGAIQRSTTFTMAPQHELSRLRLASQNLVRYIAAASPEQLSQLAREAEAHLQVLSH